MLQVLTFSFSDVYELSADITSNILLTKLKRLAWISVLSASFVLLNLAWSKKDSSVCRWGIVPVWQKGAISISNSGGVDKLMVRPLQFNTFPKNAVQCGITLYWRGIWHLYFIFNHSNGVALCMVMVSRSTTLVRTEIFHQLFDELPWNLIFFIFIRMNSNNFGDLVQLCLRHDLIW